jgi:hypothetical protein
LYNVTKAIASPLPWTVIGVKDALARGARFSTGEGVAYAVEAATKTAATARNDFIVNGSVQRVLNDVISGT